jgi:hypothetical protein
MVVRWRTDANTDSRVLYGLSLSELSSEVVDAAMTSEHEVELKGLSPETTYYYAIGTTSNILAGDSDHHFDTLPVAGTERPTRVWVIGDSGTANDNARRVRDKYLEFNGEGAYTQAWLMLGDNAYSDGTDAQYQAAVFDMYPMLLRQTPLWPTLGNHDGHSADSATQTGPYYDIFTLPKSGDAGGLASATEAYYSFDYANVHFVCLDSHDSDRSPSGDMLTWLALDLAATTQKWIIAYWHHPPFSRGSHNDNSTVRENFLPILESYGVDLVLSGHSHSYERSFLIDGFYDDASMFDPMLHLVDGGDGREDGAGAYFKDAEDAPGAVYIVAGSSGKISGGSLNHVVMYLSLNKLGSLVLDFNGDRLDVHFIDDGGLIQDYLTILKAPAGNQPPVVSAGADQSFILPGSASLDGTVSDDGLPDLPAALTTSWTVVSGQGAVTFADASAVDTIASFSIADTYVLRLTAYDGELTSSDDVMITVLPEGTTNLPPWVDAGPDQTMMLPASASLDGTVSDDGLPNPPGAVSTTWTDVSGPGTVAFADANAVDTTASFSVEGTYVLRLTADDGDAIAFDEVTVMVEQAPQMQEIRVSTGSDDAEERSSGSTSLTSSDLELVLDGSNNQKVGMRFNGVVNSKWTRRPPARPPSPFKPKPSTMRRRLPLALETSRLEPERRPRCSGLPRRGAPWEKRVPISRHRISPPSFRRW